VRHSISPNGLQQTTKIGLTFPISEAIETSFLESPTPPRKLVFNLKFLEVAYLNQFTNTIFPSLFHCAFSLTVFTGSKKCTILTHWHTEPAVRRAEPSMTLLLILALCQ
jgi:hypothetical protein